MADNLEVQASATLALDIGGTSIGAALVSPAGDVLSRETAATPLHGAPGELLAIIETLATRACRAVPAGEVNRVVGVALPGIYDRQTGVVVRAVNLPKLEGVELRLLLEQRLQRPVYIDTDVIAAGWAQWQLSDRAPRFVHLALGTGVGGAVILDGQIIRHTRGGAGHLGHLIVDTSSTATACKCGARGCLEAELSAALSANDEPRAAVRIALGLLQIAHLYAPTTIALGGGVIDHRAGLLEAVRGAFNSIRSTLVPRELEITRGPLPSKDAGVIGAALLAPQQ